DLARLTTHTGLTLSVTTLRNLHHLLAGSEKLEPMDPVAGGHQVLAEVLAIDHQTAFKIWNHFRGHSGAEDSTSVTGGYD
ncbi:MAG: hypothetical protein ACRD1T_10710, partial [Acidimicrobiia bacterium]